MTEEYLTTGKIRKFLEKLHRDYGEFSVFADKVFVYVTLRNRPSDDYSFVFQVESETLIVFYSRWNYCVVSMAADEFGIPIKFFNLIKITQEDDNVAS